MADAPQRIIVCAPDHAGTLNQALGVAEAFGRRAAALGWPIPTIRRHRPLDPALLSLPILKARLSSAIAISCGASGERKGRRLKTACPALVWTHVETLKRPGLRPDIHAVPGHDWTAAFDDEPTTLRLAGVPHRIRFEDIAPLRPDARRRLGMREEEDAAVFLIGGPNEAFAFDDVALREIGRRIEAAATASRCFVVTSRRTPAETRGALEALAGPSIAIWDGVGPLSYRDHLAAADRLFVTEDSISMTCEAVATRRPVFRLALTPRDNVRLEKFRRFQDLWSASVRPAPEAEAGRGGIAPAGPDDAGLVADAILRLLRGEIRSIAMR